MRIEPEGGAQHVHGAARPLERARHIGEVRRLTPVAREQIAQQFAALGGLLPAARVELGVATALQPRLDVEVGLAVTDVIEDRHGALGSPLVPS